MSALKIEPDGPRRERNKADKLRRIEAAARGLFAELGYDETTTRAIAERAEIAAGTLFTYFPEKRVLLMHVVRADLDDAIERAFETMPPIPGADPVDALAHLFGAIYSAYARDMRLARVFVKELLFLDDEVGVEVAAWTLSFIARLGVLLATWRDADVLAADMEPATAAHQIFALYYFCLVGWLGSAPITATLRDTMFRALLAQAMRGLAPERTTPR